MLVAWQNVSLIKIKIMPNILKFTGVFKIISRHSRKLSRCFEKLSRHFGNISRCFWKLSRHSGKLSRCFWKPSRHFGKLSRHFGNISRYFLKPSRCFFENKPIKSEKRSSFYIYKRIIQDTKSFFESCIPLYLNI
jgi:hypothetical protein